MATLLDTPSSTAETLADLLKQIGNIPPERIRAHPAPGTAVVQDVIDAERKENRLCELVDGVLVEKPMGFRESILASFLIRMLQDYVQPRNLGFVTSPDGMMEVLSGLVRLPDVAFVSWTRFPNGRIPTTAAPKVAPDLAVEILSPSNTSEEMIRKRREYFEAGVRLAWFVDPETRTVSVYASIEQYTVLGEKDGSCREVCETSQGAL